jgi:hypothetical protein
MLLEEAMRRRDPRACFFILKQQLLGRCPARDLARGVIRALERPPPTPKESEDPPGPPCEPVARRPVPALDRAAYGAAAALRDDMLGEAELLSAVPAEAGARDIAERPESLLWSADELTRIGDLRPLLDHDLSERQMMLIADEGIRRSMLQSSDQTVAPSPETEPQEPNAPND